MKNTNTFTLVLALLLCSTLHGQVVIATDGSTAHSSAMLEVKSTTKGFLPPRMTQAEREAIVSPATGLMVHQTDGTTGLYQFNGTTWRAISLSPGTQTGQMQYWNGTSWVPVSPGSDGQVLRFVNGAPVWGGEVGTNYVLNPATGKVWMDRNLGATRVATSSTDAVSYGDLYQWGRSADGHQIRTSGTTNTLSNTDTPGHDDFIINTSSIPFDWRNPQNDNLWQGANGTNNPCPYGYRLPTQTEWEAERATWSSNNTTGAFGSPLKLPMAGYREQDGTVGYFISIYSSSTVSGTNAFGLFFYSTDAFVSGTYRVRGCSVRCIKN